MTTSPARRTSSSPWVGWPSSPEHRQSAVGSEDVPVESARPFGPRRHRCRHLVAEWSAHGRDARVSRGRGDRDAERAQAPRGSASAPAVPRLGGEEDRGRQPKGQHRGAPEKRALAAQGRRRLPARASRRCHDWNWDLVFVSTAGARRVIAAHVFPPTYPTLRDGNMLAVSSSGDKVVVNTATGGGFGSPYKDTRVISLPAGQVLQKKSDFGGGGRPALLAYGTDRVLLTTHQPGNSSYADTKWWTPATGAVTAIRDNTDGEAADLSAWQWAVRGPQVGELHTCRASRRPPNPTGRRWRMIAGSRPISVHGHSTTRRSWATTGGTSTTRRRSTPTSFTALPTAPICSASGATRSPGSSGRPAQRC